MKNFPVYILLIAVLSWSGIACEKETVHFCPMGSLEYMIFGHFYGECVGEGCVEIYKIDFFDKTLAENTDDIYPSGAGPYEGENYNFLSNEQYNLVKDLVDDFPAQLLSEDAHVFGNPDGGDWGGLYVEIRRFGDAAGSGFWLLDKNEENMPEVYNAFADRINDKIALINE